MSNPLIRNDASQRTMLFIACSTAIVMLLWLPFGFNMMGHIEEWDLLNLFTRHGVFYVVGEGGPLPSHRMRPLMLLPNAIAYQLSPNSFFAMHLLQMLALVLKGVCGGILGWWLLRSRLYAVLLALLVVIYPADTMQLSFRLLPYQLVCLAGICRRDRDSACIWKSIDGQEQGDPGIACVYRNVGCCHADL